MCAFVILAIDLLDIRPKSRRAVTPEREKARKLNYLAEVVFSDLPEKGLITTDGVVI